MLPFYKDNTLEVGIDECARGSLCGPVYAAAVIIPPDFDIPVKDSKKLSRRRRLIFKDEIEENAIDYAVASIDNHQIDQINILNATFKTMHLALKNLNVEPEHIIVDGNRFKLFRNKNGYLIPHTCIIGGDDQYMSIASASILAKVAHDEYIDKLCDEYPLLDEYYGLRSNMGYGTQRHRDGIEKYGITELHRQSYKCCKGKEILDSMT